MTPKLKKPAHKKRIHFFIMIKKKLRLLKNIAKRHKKRKNMHLAKQ